MGTDLDDNNELFQGLMKLQEDCTPLERAESCKEQGNDFFKEGKKRLQEAIYCYTKGLSEPFEERNDLRATLHANRAMANLQLKNYGRVITDCRKAIEYDPNYVKAYYRAASAAVELKKFKMADNFCTNGLKVDPKNKPLVKLAKECKEKWRIHEEREEKRNREREERENAKAKLDNAISERNLVLGKSQHQMSAQFQGEVHWDENEQTLHWPVVFAYPEYSQCDFIESFPETDRIIDHLESMFPENERVFWDEKQEYVCKSLCVYYQTNSTDILGKGTNYKKKVWKKINPKLTLLEVLQLPEHIIPKIPILTVFVEKSNYLKEFLEREKDN